MGSDTIPARSGGQTITAQFFNLLRSVLGVDLVPRNSSGIATDLAGSVGTSTYRFLSAFAQKYNLGAPASGLSIEESSGAIIIKVGGVEAFRLTSGGVVTASNDFTAKTIGRAALKDAVNYQLSSVFDFNSNSTSIVDVTGASVTINRTGKPLHICLVPDGSSSSDSGLEIRDSTGGDARANIYLNEAGTDIDKVDLWTLQSSTGATLLRQIFPPSILQFFVWNTTTGNVTYKLRMDVNTTNEYLYFNKCKFLVREI